MFIIVVNCSISFVIIFCMNMYERERVRGWSVSRDREEGIIGCTSNK